MDSEERSMTANQRRAMNKRETKKRLAAKGAPAVQPRTTHPEVQAEQKEAGQEVEEDDESQEQYDSGLYGGKDESIQDPSSIAEDIVAGFFPCITTGESDHSTTVTSPSDHFPSGKYHIEQLVTGKYISIGLASATTLPAQKR